MRSVISSLVLLLLPTLAPAQGSLIPRSCVGRPCPADGPCRPCVPGNPNVVKKSSHVTAELSDRVLRYEVSEIFVNQGGRVGEADYIFPLPKGAAFQDLKLSINGELIAGETMSASEARSIYEEIVRRQRDPALVEWMGYGMLRARIFPIAPGEEKKVVVRFQMVAEREGDALRVDYFQGKRNLETWMQFAGSRGDDPSSSFTLRYPAAGMYGSPYSPTHAISTDRRGSRNEIRVREGGSEITILLPVRRTTQPAISVLTYAPAREEGFALITLTPPALASKATPRDVTLVLDVSGSMAGVKIRQAREAGKQLLATLNSSDRFKLIDFSTDVRSFRDEFVPATSANIAAGTRYLESLDASGSTNISGALDEALRDGKSPGRLGLVLFVTDGAPTVGEKNPEAIAARVSRLRKDRRIFSFGVGADLNVSLVERLALEGRGTAQFVRPEESVERAVSIVAARLANPVVTNLRVRAEGVRLLKRHPAEVADIFAGQDFVLLSRYEGSGVTRLVFEGESAQGLVSWSQRVVFPAASRDNPFVARLWATQRIGFLSAEKRRNGGSREIDDEIRNLGETYAIPTEFTSYLVMEPGMRRAQQPVFGDVVATGVATATAPPPSARVFEEARAASKQRAVTNLAAADEADLSKAGSAARRVGARLFTLRGDTWTDMRKADSTNTVKVKAFSAAYFRLMELIPELRDIFALGEKVIVAGKGVVIEAGPAGVESLGDDALKRIQSQW